jgi:hypothetical protein
MGVPSSVLNPASRDYGECLNVDHRGLIAGWLAGQVMKGGGYGVC